jgi:hypothetical protein
MGGSGYSATQISREPHGDLNPFNGAVPPRAPEVTTCTVATRAVTRRDFNSTRLFALRWVRSRRGNYPRGYNVAPSVGWFVHPDVTLRDGCASRVHSARAPHRIWVWGENAWGRLIRASLVLNPGMGPEARTRRRAARPVPRRTQPGPPRGTRPPPFQVTRPPPPRVTRPSPFRETGLALPRVTRATLPRTLGPSLPFRRGPRWPRRPGPCPAGRG